MERHSAEQLRTAGEQLSGQQEEVKQALVATQDQTSQYRHVLQQQRAELQDHMESSRKLVQGFLQDELQQDVPTGTRSDPGPRLISRLVYPESLTSPVDAFRCHPSASGVCVSQAADEAAEPQ